MLWWRSLLDSFWCNLRSRHHQILKWLFSCHCVSHLTLWRYIYIYTCHNKYCIGIDFCWHVERFQQVKQQLSSDWSKAVCVSWWILYSMKKKIVFKIEDLWTRFTTAYNTQQSVCVCVLCVCLCSSLFLSAEQFWVITRWMCEQRLSPQSHPNICSHRSHLSSHSSPSHSPPTPSRASVAVRRRPSSPVG